MWLELWQSFVRLERSSGTGGGHMPIKVLLQPFRRPDSHVEAELASADGEPEYCPDRSWQPVGSEYTSGFPHIISMSLADATSLSACLDSLGGGISYFSQQRGWAANNIVNYEVVTASSKVIQVNAQSHSDLFWALKGGSNNFGIVTL
jgi:hypothetical protein